MRLRALGPFFYVRPDEEVLLRVAPGSGFATVVFAPIAAVATVALVAVALVDRFVRPLLPWVLTAAAVGFVAALVAGALFGWRRAVTSEYVVTDARIYARVGRLRTMLHFTTHDKITDILLKQGPLDRMAGVGHVTFATAGGEVTVAGVADPIFVKETAEAARDRFIQRLLEEAGVDSRVAPSAPRATEREAPEQALPPPLPPLPGPGPSPRPLPSYVKQGDVAVWLGKPSLAAAVGAVAPLAGLASIALFMGITGSGIPFSRSVPLLGVVAAALIGYRILDLRRTEYVVTDRRVYLRRGVFGTTVTQLTYDKITDLTYRQDIIGRILGFGGITVNTAGSERAPVVMVGLPDALAVKETVERARAHALREDEA